MTPLTPPARSGTDDCTCGHWRKHHERGTGKCFAEDRVECRCRAFAEPAASSDGGQEPTWLQQLRAELAAADPEDGDARAELTIAQVAYLLASAPSPVEPNGGLTEAEVTDIVDRAFAAPVEAPPKDDETTAKLKKALALLDDADKKGLVEWNAIPVAIAIAQAIQHLTALRQAHEQLQQENARLKAAMVNEPKRVCMDCSEVFEWQQVDDIGRCGRCYKRFAEGQPRLNPGAGVHPDKRYAAESRLHAVTAERNSLLRASMELVESIFPKVDKAVARIQEWHDAAYKLQAVTQERDEYKALASVGTWHKDCRPNRKKAAEEIQKSQHRIDVLVEAALIAQAQLATLQTALRTLVEEMSAFADRRDRRSAFGNAVQQWAGRLAALLPDPLPGATP